MVWLTAGALALKAYGNYKKGKAKRKAAKAQAKQMQIALQQYMNGSSDAYGNKLSADPSGHWKYDLTYSTDKAKQAADRANVLLGTTANKTSDQLRRQNTFGNQLANTMTARANQNAAMRSGARTNSNLGNISTSFGQAGSQKLRDNYVQGLKNSQDAVNYNANMKNNLAQMATNTAAPINNIQSNLQNMVNTLNATALGQGNNIAKAVSNPYMHGLAKGELYEGLGSGLEAYSQNQQQQANFDALLKALMASGGGA